MREGQEYIVGIDLGKRLHERLDLTLSYLFDYRNSSNSRSINAGRLMVAGLNPGKSSDVYDIKGHSVGIQFNTPLTQQWLLLLAYNFRYGDVVSSNTPARAPRISGIVDAVAIDDAFPGWAYRAEGKTHRYSVDANYAFGKGHAAVNLGYEFVESHVDSFSYRNNLFRINFNYSF
jgi:hypothetical protein